MSGIIRNPLLGLALLGLLAAPVAAGGEGPTPEAEVSAASPWASGDWFGARDHLARRGVEVTLVVQADPSTNLSGGVRQSTAIRVPLQAAIDLDTERLFGWRGGHVHAGAQALEGRHGSEILVGDLQGFNNVDADRFRQISELWLEQWLLGDRLRVKLGKADANADFARVDASGEFLNSSAGYSPTIQGFPSYPDPAVSASVFAAATPWLSLGAGVYDGATHEGGYGRTGNRGFGVLLSGPDALFAVGEAGLHYSLSGRSGRLSVGAWRHTGTFHGFDGTTRRGTGGFYAVLEQRLWQDPGDGGRGLDLFAQLGSSDARFAEIDHHLALGLSATGLVPGRDHDTLGLMVTSAAMSAFHTEVGSERSESVLELFYGLSLRPWLVVKPDLQYIVNPGAVGGKDAFVGTVRVTLAF